MSKEISDFLKRMAEQCGFSRSRYVEKNMPTSFDNLFIIPFFADHKSSFIASSLILNQYKRVKSNKYIIVCSWPGQEVLYPYADEFWFPKEGIHHLVDGATHMFNTSDLSTQYNRNFLNRLENVVLYEDLQKYYYKGLQPSYFQEFQEIRRFFPAIPSYSSANSVFINEMARPGKKVVVYPSLKINSWQKGKNVKFLSLKDFWITLVNRLLEEGYLPVIYQDRFTYNLSEEFNNQCIYLVAQEMGEILTCLRHVGCVLDIFNGISRLAIMARCPFVCVDERIRYIEEKDYEIDDLCAQNIPRQYIFSFSSFLIAGDKNQWTNSVIDNLVVKLDELLPKLQKSDWPSSSASEEILSYNCVRDHKNKRMGVKFIRKR